MRGIGREGFVFWLVVFLEKLVHSHFPDIGIGENQLLPNEIVENGGNDRNFFEGWKDSLIFPMVHVPWAPFGIFDDYVLLSGIPVMGGTWGMIARGRPLDVRKALIALSAARRPFPS
jgi:hypothetical protein